VRLWTDRRLIADTVDNGLGVRPIAMDAMTYDGVADRHDRLEQHQRRFYSLSPTATGPGRCSGRPTCCATSPAWLPMRPTLYRRPTDATTATEGIYRLPRGDLAAAPVLALVDISTLRASIGVDDLTTAGYLCLDA
jgi:hypothetical protein